MIDPYLIRSRLFLALGVPADLCPLLHAWAIVENRKFCHEFMGQLLCLHGSEKAIRIAVGRKLNALALFSKTSGNNFGIINRKGNGRVKEPTAYGSLALNRAVSWIQKKLSADPDISNPFVAVDRYVLEAITRHIPKTKSFVCVSKPNTKKRLSTKKQRERLDSHTLGLRSVALFNLPNCTFGYALEMSRLGFPVFPVHTAVNGVCSCRLARECKNPGKHPCVAGWRQVATCYEPSIIRLWEKFPLANIGIATGCRLKTGGFLTVLDCDERAFGHGSISHLERNELCPLPVTREHSNGGGSFNSHKLFSYPRGFHSRPGALGQGIDVQSFGKFVVAPGSTHKSGRVYRVTVDCSIARLPDEWANRIDAIRNKALSLIPEGERGTWLLRCAGGMVCEGMSPGLILETLKDRRDRRCAKGSHSFSDDDLRAKIAYCLRQESRKQKEQAA